MAKEDIAVDKSANPRSQTEENLVSEVYWGSAEESYFKSPMVPESYESPYNSDDLWKKTGDYSIYEEMLQDDQIAVCLNFKKDLVMGSGFSIVSENEDNEEIKEDLLCALTDEIDEPFLEQVEELLTGYEYGFSLTEKIFKVSDDSKLRLKCLKTRHPNSWLMHQDDLGYVTRFQQNTAKGYKDINPKSLIHFVNNKRFQNAYGTSDLRAAYAAWFAKRHVVRYYGIFMEGSAKPIPVGKYNKNAPQSAVDKLFNVLKNFQAKTAITIPDDITVDFLESKSNGEAYSKAINIFNMFIGRALFIPDLLGISGSETGGGSFSLGTQQIKMFLMHIDKRRRSLEDLINRHIIKPMVIYNYGFVEKMPKFQFNPLEDAQATEYAKQWLEFVKAKICQPTEAEINHFRNLIKFPQSDIEFINPPDPTGDINLSDPIEPTEEKEVEKEDPPVKEFKSMKMDIGDYYKKVNFKAIENKLNDYDQSIIDDTRRVVNKIYEDLYEQLSKKKIVHSQDLARAETIKLRYLKELKQVMKNSFMQLYKDAQGQASAELLKSEFKNPILGDDFLQILEDETFAFIGDWQYNVLKNARVQLASAIKDGKPLSEVISALDIDAKKLSSEQIARYARTKHTEVLNKGRLEFFKESGVVAAYQYSAVLDDVTSELCASLNGKVFKAGDEPVPPLHFNCRSVLIPITKYEDFDPDTKVGSKNIQDYIEDNKGKGFPVR